MNDHVQNPMSDVPAIGVSYSFQADDFRNMVLQAHIPASCNPDELNGLIDKIARACERQRAKSHLPTARNILAEKLAGLKAEQETLLSVSAERDASLRRWNESHTTTGRRGEFKLLPQQQQQKNAMDQAVGKAEQNVRVLDKEIRDLERRVADFEALVGDVEG